MNDTYKVRAVKRNNYRTRIRVQYSKEVRNPGDLESNFEWIDVGNTLSTDKPIYRYCSWVNAHGQDVMLNDKLLSDEVARVRMPYDPRITSEHTIIKGDDNSKRYKINGTPDNIRDENREIEFLVKRYMP